MIAHTAMPHAAMLPTLIDYAMSVTLVLAILMLGVRKLSARVFLYALQSLALVLALVFIGMLNHSAQAFWVAACTVLGKCVIIPWVLTLVLQKVRMKKEVESVYTLPTTMLMGGGLILLAHYLTFLLFPQEGRLFSEVFSVGASLVLIGLMVMMTFKKAFTQILGLYVLDNGIFCLTLATVFEMPLMIEMGILFELLLGVLVLGLFVYRIKQSFDTVNVDYLKELHD